MGVSFGFKKQFEQEFSKPLGDLLNFVLVCKEISPRYGNDKSKVFFSTVAKTVINK